MKAYELMQLLACKPSGAEVLIDTGDGPWPAVAVGYEGDRVVVSFEDRPTPCIDVEREGDDAE